MKKYQMWINGEFVDAASGKTYTTVNPATEAIIGEIPLGDKADVNAAVDAATKAYPEWSNKPQADRTRIMMEIAGKIRNHTKELIEMDLIDHGSPIGMATAFGSMTPMHFEAAAGLAKTLMSEAELLMSPGLLPYLQRVPVGVVAGIVPWNIPLMIAAKIAQSLAVGNTCVVKPPSCNSIGAIQIAQAIAEHPELPRGAVNIITGPGGTLGEALASHPGVRMVAFTGSCETGKRIAELGSSTVKKLFLELGGKNPFVICEDADVEKTVAGLADAQFFNTGMLCGAPGRVYVHESQHDMYVEKFIELAKKCVTGDPNDPKTQMGPVVSAEHRDKVESYYKIGVDEGAELVYGGKRPTEAPMDKGYYVTPTVFANVKQNMRLAREEIFGPVAVFMKYSSEDELISLINDNTFGLACSVWSQDLDKAFRMSKEIEAGMVWINTHNATGGLPWGGMKESGYGKENTMHGLKEFTCLKGVCAQL